MQHLKLSVLALSAALALASCGGPAPTPKVDEQKPAPEQPAPEPEPTTGPVTGGTIAKPADATAANEFIITGVRAKALAQSLGIKTAAASGGLKAQATEDEMRVLLAITRSKSGTNVGKKKAVATFVWGNGQEKVLPLGTTKEQPGVTLDIYPQGNEAAKTTYTGSLNLEVTYPDFQDKTTRSGPYVNDTGTQCARLTFDLTTAPNSGDTTGYVPLLFNNASSALEVCEGISERNAERVALEKNSAGLLYNYRSQAAAKFSFLKFEELTAMPDEARVRAAVSAPADAEVVQMSLDDWFAPLIELPAGDSENWTAEEKARAATARKYQTLKKQYGYYYREARVYLVKTSSERTDILILGLNGWGVGGLQTVQFPAPDLDI